MTADPLQVVDLEMVVILRVAEALAAGSRESEGLTGNAWGRLAKAVGSDCQRSRWPVRREWQSAPHAGAFETEKTARQSEREGDIGDCRAIQREIGRAERENLDRRVIGRKGKA